MASFTSKANGNWSTSGQVVWNEVGTPTTGDTVSISHSVTVDTAQSVGPSGPGAPQAAPTLGKTTGGSLPATTYFVFYTHVDAGGKESYFSPLASLATDATNNRLQVTLPSLPTGVSSYNIYVSSAGTRYLQLSGLTTTGPHNIDSISTTTAYPYADTAIRVTGANGRLIINANLTIKGDVILDGTTTAANVIVTQAAGVTVEFDSTGSATTGHGYVLRTGLTNGNKSLYWKANGTSGSRCILRTKSGGPYTWSDSTASTETGDLDLAYCDVSRLGLSGNEAWMVASSGTSARILLDHCVFDACGRIHLSNALSAATNFSVTNCTWKNSSSGENLRMQTTATAGTGLRVLTDVVFDKIARINPVSMIWTDNIHLSFPTTPGAQRTPAAMARNFFRLTGVDSAYRIGDWDECAMVVDASTYDGAGAYSAKADMTNPHWTTPNGGPTGTYRIDRTIFESFGADGAGDVDYGPNNTNFNSILTYCIGVPEDRDSGSEYSVGTLTTFNGWSGASSSYEHITWYCGTQGAISLSEAGNGFAGMLASYKSNIAWNRNRGAESSTTYNRHTYIPTAINNFTGKNGTMVTAADYNCRHNLYTGGGTETVTGAYTDGGAEGKSYHHYDTAGTTFGANDQSVDPQFVDDTRRFWTWVSDLLGGTHPLTGSPDRKDWQAYGLYLLSLKNEPSHADYNAGATLAAYKTWIRNGFAPTNPALQNAGHDSVTIGAVEGVFGAPIPVLMNQYRQRVA